MDSNFKNIKDLFSEDAQHLPPELDWAQMESGILDKMDQLEPSVDPRPSPVTQKRLLGIVVTIIALLCIPFICPFSINEQSEQAISIEQIAETTITSSQKITHTRKVDDKTNNTPIVLEDLSQEKNTKTSLIVKEKAVAQIVVAKQKTFVKKQVQTKTTLDYVSTKLPDNPIYADLKNQQQTKDIQSSPFVLLTKQMKPLENRLAVQLPNLAAVTDNEPLVEKEAKSFSNRLMLSSGLSLWEAAYGKTRPERASFEQTIPSFHAQINYIHPFKKDYFWTIGLQFQQLESRLNWTEFISEHSILLEDVILEVHTNAFTGQTQNEVRGDVEVMVPADRMVEHFNTIKSIQIPLAVGKSWAFNKWQADAFVGGTVAFWTAQKGRTIYNQNLYDYAGTSTDFLDNQWKFQGLVGTTIAYQLTNQLGLSGGIQVQKSLMNWSKEADISMRPTVINLNMGLVYLLD